MTNEQDKDQNLQDYARKLGDAAWNTAKKAGKIAADAALDPNVYSKIYQGLKTGAKEGAKFALKTGVTLATNPKQALHTAIGLAERAVSSIPLIGNALSFGLGTAKDALLDAKLETLSKNIQGLKDGLENLANSTAQALDGLRGEMQEALEAMGARQDQLEQFTKAFQAEQEKVNQQVQKNIENIEETLQEHEKKIKDNSEKIFKEQIKLEDVRGELKDQIRVTNTNLDNLRKEQSETKQDFEKYKHQINEKTVKTEQAFEDLQADYTRHNKILETQIKDNEEQLSEFQENLANVEYEQKKLNLEHQELAETLEEQVNLAREQKNRLDLVVNEIEEIEEEFNQRISKIQREQLEQEEKIDEAVFAAKQATRKVDEIADKLEKHNKKVDKLAEKIVHNKKLTEEAKKEAQWANERIDNLLKTQKLLDTSAEDMALDKIQKTLQLKAEEAQLLASLELLKKTQKLITQPSEREWKVGIKEGTEKQIPRPEGMPLKPDSREHETAPLTDPEKRKPEEAAPSQPQQQQEQTEQSSEQQKNLQEVIEDTKSQLLEQLQEIQEQINENITPLEEITTASREDSESEEEEIKKLEQKEQQLVSEKAQAQAKFVQSRNQQQATQQQQAQIKAEIVKEQKQIQKIEQSLGQKSTTPQQKQKLQENKEKREEKLIQLQKQLEQTEQAEKKLEKQVEKGEKEVQKKEQEIKKVQQQPPSAILAKKLAKEIKDAEQQANQAKHDPETPTLKKIEEKIQEIKESQSSTAAPQKSMSLYMLYLIIFLLEYIVYKKNGLTGIYGYTYWKSKKEITVKEKELIETQEEFAEKVIKNETEYIERLQEASENLEKVKAKIKTSQTVNFAILSQGIGTPSNIFFTNQQEVEQLKKAEQQLAEKIQNKQNEQVYQEISQTLVKIPAYPPDFKPGEELPHDNFVTITCYTESSIPNLSGRTVIFLEEIKEEVDEQREIVIHKKTQEDYQRDQLGVIGTIGSAHSDKKIRLEHWENCSSSPEEVRTLAKQKLGELPAPRKEIEKLLKALLFTMQAKELEKNMKHDIKSIKLNDSKLIIEYNNSTTETRTSTEPELQQIRSYCQARGLNTLALTDLQKQGTNTQQPTNYLPYILGGIGINSSGGISCLFLAKKEKKIMQEQFIQPSKIIGIEKLPIKVKKPTQKRTAIAFGLHVTHQEIGRKPKTKDPILAKLLRYYTSQLKKGDISNQREVANLIFRETGQKISQPTISRFLKRKKVTHKKINYHYTEQLNHPEKIAKFVEQIPTLSKSPVLAIDECSFHLNEVPRYSYAEKGKRANRRKPSKKGDNHTLILCIQNIKGRGIVKWELIPRGMKSKDFHKFISSLNLPTDQKLYLLLDNLKVHHATKSCQNEGLSTIKELLESKNIEPEYLPPYTPELNPVELCFNFLRQNTEKKKPRTFEELEASIDKAIKMLEQKDLTKYFQHCWEYFDKDKEREKDTEKGIKKSIRSN
ncbi:9170_t:CDS:10 [Ambispora gerdemannii]|uniref:9170_t:CDS:1 n=1 Tax=Ambispora gerdemannii TaxID=144530 RepID=A0A9N9CF49_9GLOM|nr:9170_t:CDS:10 [Ambispora gerdemannii]